MSIEVIRPGLLSTVQDEGRTGYRRYGIHPGESWTPLQPE